MPKNVQIPEIPVVRRREKPCRKALGKPEQRAAKRVQTRRIASPRLCEERQGWHPLRPPLPVRPQCFETVELLGNFAFLLNPRPKGSKVPI